MTAATLHACTPSDATVATLRRGARSSVREVCTHCQKTKTWLMANSGAIVALALETRKR